MVVAWVGSAYRVDEVEIGRWLAIIITATVDG